MTQPFDVNAPPDTLEPPLEGELLDPWSNTEEHHRIVTTLDSELNSARNSRRKHDDDVRKWRSYYELRIPDRTPLWDGAANYRTPLIRNKVDKIAAQIIAALNVNPFFTVRARTSSVEDQRTNLEEFIDSKVDELRIRGLAQMAVPETLLVGTTFVKVVYQREGSGLQAVERNNVEIVQFEDLFINPITVSRLEDAFLVAHRFWATRQRLRQLQEDGLIHPDCDVDALSENDDGDASTNTVVNDQQGHAQSNGGTRESDLIPVYECWWQDRDGMKITWYHRSGQKILRHEANPYDHGRAPFACIRYQPRPNYLFGASMAEVLAPTQLELDAVTNARMDANSLSVGGMFMVEKNSEADKYFAEYGLQPGAVIKVTDLNHPGIAPLQLPGANPVTLQDQQILLQFADQSTIPDSSLAQPLQSRDPTATEVRRDTAVTNAVMRGWLGNLHEGFRDIGYFILHNLYQFEIEPTGQVQFLTRDAAKVIAADGVFLKELELEVTGQETQTMREERLNKANVALQMLVPYLSQLNASNPLGAGSPVPIMDARVYASFEMLLKAMDFKNVEDLLGPKPPAVEAMQFLSTMLGGAGGDSSAMAANPAGTPTQPTTGV
jgi:hypothetical protein